MCVCVCVVLSADFQNIGVNGARTGSMANEIMFTLGRNQNTDHPLILNYALIGNGTFCVPSFFHHFSLFAAFAIRGAHARSCPSAVGADVCNGHYGTGSMTTPPEFYANVLRGTASFFLFSCVACATMILMFASCSAQPPGHRAARGQPRRVHRPRRWSRALRCPCHPPAPSRFVACPHIVALVITRVQKLTHVSRVIQACCTVTSPTHTTTTS